MFLNERVCKKYTNHTQYEIKQFINRCISLIKQGKKEYLNSNDRNFYFQVEYGIQDIWRIVSLLSVEYFCYSADDYQITQNGTKKGRTYIFKIPYILEDKNTDIYIQITIEQKIDDEVVFVLSFHKPENPLKVLWND